jgi:hypothetical protein
MGWSQLADMELDDEAVMDMPMPLPMPDRPRYPCHLKGAFCDAELDKLGLDADCEVGQEFDFKGRARVTSVHKEDGCRRVEWQIEKMAVENEMEAED